MFTRVGEGRNFKKEQRKTIFLQTQCHTAEPQVPWRLTESVDVWARDSLPLLVC